MLGDIRKPFNDKGQESNFNIGWRLSEQWHNKKLITLIRKENPWVGFSASCLIGH